MKDKICSKCKEVRPIENFNKDKRYPDGRRNICKECKYTPEFIERVKKYSVEYRKDYYLKNKEYFSEYHKRYREENKEVLKEKKKEYYENNKEDILERYNNNKEHSSIVNKKWRENNKEHLREYKRVYNNYRKNTDYLFKLKCSIRSLICNSIKSKYTSKSKKTIEILGCDFDFFKIYIENQFTEDMSWDNYGTYWHLDHKIPASWSIDEEHLYELNHYTNFQPLYWLDNLIKGNRYST